MQKIKDTIESLLAQVLTPANQWLATLEQRERQLVIGGSIALVIMFFYLAIWEPVTSNFEQQQSQHESQRKLHSWMKNAATEIKSLKATSGNNIARFRNQSISSLADRSATTSGMKPYIEKIEQSKTGVKITLKTASFDSMIAWLSDLQNKYGIFVVKVKIEKSKEAGAVDAKITLERSS
ncbi:hypothetical protein MNBD_GAMMA11-803 [hydrothermal vent metagenome]|uniref:General secretion pathway protein M n=1 Tax=hydrothermal vent metagenome TaxID=652676 RepID=A0A3B0X2T1_9ZZZZ